MDCSLPSSFVHGVFPGKNTEVGCHFLLQGIFPIQASNLSFLPWQVGSLPLASLGCASLLPGDASGSPPSGGHTASPTSRVSNSVVWLGAGRWEGQGWGLRISILTSSWAMLMLHFTSASKIKMVLYYTYIHTIYTTLNLAFFHLILYLTTFPCHPHSITTFLLRAASSEIFA